MTPMTRPRIVEHATPRMRSRVPSPMTITAYAGVR
jgi:hypothetical protein